MQKRKITRTQTHQALNIIPRMAQRQQYPIPIDGTLGRLGSTFCMVCREPLRRALDRGEAICVNPACSKYVVEHVDGG